MQIYHNVRTSQAVFQATVSEHTAPHLAQLARTSAGHEIASADVTTRDRSSAAGRHLRIEATFNISGA